MAQPEWTTSAGNLGTYPAGEMLSIPLQALAILPSDQIFYKLLAGSLPPGLSINQFGLLIGIPDNVSSEAITTYYKSN
jgi:hypothetical protein